MAAGDLTQKITVSRDDTVGHLQKALSQLNVNLLSIVRDARLEAERMQVSTQEIAQGNQDLSARTESQASNREQTAASMEEITGTVRQTAESARQATSLATQATTAAERSSEAVNSVADTMHQIQTASGRISEITQLIDSIAFQTNILALNAVVEGRPRGRAGPGFAVVASGSAQPVAPHPVGCERNSPADRRFSQQGARGQREDGFRPENHDRGPGAGAPRELADE